MGYFEYRKKELEELIDLIKEAEEAIDIKVARERHSIEKGKKINEEIIKRERLEIEEKIKKERENIKIRADEIKREVQKEKEEIILKKLEIEEKEKEVLTLQEGVIEMAKERQIGFPWLANAYEELFQLYDNEYANYIASKKNPAIRASEAIKQEANRRRQAEKENKILHYQTQYYEYVAPFLLELKEEVPDEKEEDSENLKEYTEKEREDEATKFLTKAEYRKLSSVDKNQMALDRFWKRPKSKWLIGRLYERYVGYLFEEKGFEVEYVGIFKGYEDLGRDLICKKGDKIIVIQCKNWSKFKTIYEKHIFQFFGTVFQYKDKNQNKKVEAIFYCTTKLSELAKRFSKELGIKLEEKHKFDQNYPCIKCNISKIDGTKIYHLPFDQQYDKVKIEKDKGEFYCKSVKEAEDAGFRRAFRYKGYKKD